MFPPPRSVLPLRHLPVLWALLGGALVYGVLKATVGLRLSQEEEFDGADLSIHKISATPDREVSW